MINSENTDLPDEKLVEEILVGNNNAFKCLYYRYFKQLIRFAWYRVHSVDIARDLVQDVFVNTWQNRNHLDPRKSIKAYLYKSLNNTIINHLKLHYSQTISLEDVSENKRSAENENLDMMIDIRKAVDHLPEKLKIVYTLSRLEGYKYSEIAEICNISVKAVEKRLTQSFNILRKTFSKKYF